MSPQASPPVLEFRSLDGEPVRPWSVRKTFGVVLGWFLLGAGVLFGALVYLAAVFGKVELANPDEWPRLWDLLEKLADAGWHGVAAAHWTSWIEPLIGLVAVPILLQLLLAQRRRRLHIGDVELRLVSGLPSWLDKGAWGSWTMAYSDIGVVDLVNYRAGRAYGPRPLQTVALEFKNDKGQVLRRLQVAPWYWPDEPARPKLESNTTWLGLQVGTWNSSQDQHMLTQAYEDLPLVQSLRQRGVRVPLLASGRGADGDNLFENPRMKAVIVAALALAPVYFAGAFLLREYWVVSPPAGFWLALGLFAAVAGGLWMRGQAADDLWPPQLPGSTAARSAPTSRAILANQLIVSMLFGLSATGAAMAGVPLVNQWLFPAEDAVFVVRDDATLEPAEAARGLPSFRSKQSTDFWSSRKPGTQYTLLMRKLPWGYWQYGVDAFRPEIEAFEYPAAK